MTTDPSAKLKAAKNSLVASLFELSKSANQTASSIVDFYNSVGDDEEEKLEAFTTLTESLQTLTSATSNINEIGMDLIHGTSNDALKDETNDASSPSSSNAHSKKKRAEKDPNAPKKPLTVFFAYSAFARQQLRADRENEGLPPLSSTEITQEISKKWKVLDEEEKDKWRAAYNVELEHYQMEKQKYLESKKNGDSTLSQSEPPLISSPELQLPTFEDDELATNPIEEEKIKKDETQESDHGEKRPLEEDNLTIVDSGEKKKKKKKKKKDKKKKDKKDKASA